MDIFLTTSSLKDSFRWVMLVVYIRSKNMKKGNDFLSKISGVCNEEESIDIKRKSINDSV